jgi:hypothetical protein
MIPDVGALGGDVFDDLMNGGLRVLLSLVLGHQVRMRDAAQLRTAGAVVTMTDSVVSSHARSPPCTF